MVKHILLILKQKNGKLNLIRRTINKKFSEEVIDAKTGKIVIKAGDKINYLNAKKMFNDGLKDILISNESLFGKFLHKEIKVSDDENGILKIVTEINDTIIKQILDQN